jgi:hypothetical protein
MNNDIKFILYTIDDEYANFLGEKHIVNLQINWASVLRTAQNNRILYIFSKSALSKYSSLNLKIKTVLETIVREGNLWLERFNNTLSLLVDYLGYQNFCVIKTFKFFQDITFDVDIVLLNDNLFEQINKLSKDDRANFVLNKIKGGYELNPKNRNFLPIDVYEDFLFRDKSIVDKNFICSNILRLYKAIDGCYYIPSIEGELLLYISQVNFQLHFITLHDFIQITTTISKNSIDWNNLLAEVAKHGWLRSFVSTLSVINGLYLKLYEKELNTPIKPYKNVKCSFPYVMPLSTILKSDFEMFRIPSLGKYIFKDFQYFIYEFLSFYIRKRTPTYSNWISIEAFRNELFEYNIPSTNPLIK